MTTGSLGQGGSAALGMAMALKKAGQYVYLIMGDGECNEGAGLGNGSVRGSP